MKHSVTVSMTHDQWNIVPTDGDQQFTTTQSCGLNSFGVDCTLCYTNISNICLSFWLSNEGFVKALARCQNRLWTRHPSIGIQGTALYAYSQFSITHPKCTSAMCQIVNFCKTYSKVNAKVWSPSCGHSIFRACWFTCRLYFCGMILLRGCCLRHLKRLQVSLSLLWSSCSGRYATSFTIAKEKKVLAVSISKGRLGYPAEGTLGHCGDLFTFPTFSAYICAEQVTLLIAPMQPNPNHL